MDAIFKKIHEGVDLFNYYYTRHDSLTNDSQREKLEGDLKKEVKKLQKYREQIKSWQSNELIEAVISLSRLQEHRKMVEESMEKYKEVEKSSKMKSFSNQSIMLSKLEDMEDNDLSEEAQEAVDFLMEKTEEINQQAEKLEEEYEKLNQKKLRKNNQHLIEERKQEIESFNARNNFHRERIEQVIHFIKQNKVDPESIWVIQEDLSFYVESNQEPDFIYDDTLYDEIYKEAKENEENHTLHDNHVTDGPSFSVLAEEFDGNNPDNLFVTGDDSAQSTPVKPKQPSIPNADILPSKRIIESLNTIKSASPQPPSPSPSSSTSSTHPLSQQSSSYSLHQSKDDTAPSPDIASSSIIRNLKPAVAPVKPAGALKWSVAAAAATNLPSTQQQQPFIQPPSTSSSVEQPTTAATSTLPSSSSSPKVQMEKLNQPTTHNNKIQIPALVPEENSLASTVSTSQHSMNNISALSSDRNQTSLSSTSLLKPSKSNGMINDEPVQPLNAEKLAQYVDIIRQSSLSLVEKEFFTQPDLVCLPPGIQDLVISYKAVRNYSDDAKLLIKLGEDYQYSTPISKPYLPSISSKPHLQLFKLQLYWNSIRAKNLFELFVQEIELLSSQNNTDNTPLINDMTFVLFFGYYYGVTPMENLIAESCLRELGWVPYSSSPLPNQKLTNSVDSFTHWFKTIKVLNTSSNGTNDEVFHIGDYYVFDLNFWEIYIKNGYRFESNLARLEPSKVLC